VRLKAEAERKSAAAERAGSLSGDSTFGGRGGRVVWTEGGLGVTMCGMQVYPLKFEPIYKRRIWGGQRLREALGKDIPTGVKVGESWEVADLAEDKSVIINGELAGRTLCEAIETYGAEITGKTERSGGFGLLIKFLDAEDVLSVQVHPDAATCSRMGRGDAKTECWYVVWAGPDAVLYKGVKRGVTRESFAEAIEKGTAAELLEKIPVEAGECHFLPAGTAHSVGGGLVIAEVQTPSDTTYRVFDWNRVDDTGRSRTLHIEEALESIHFDVSGRDLPVTRTGRLVECEYFTVDKGHQAKGCELLLSRGRVKVLIFITGGGRIRAGDESVVEFTCGDCVLIPAGYEGAVCFTAETEYLSVCC